MYKIAQGVLVGLVIKELLPIIIDSLKELLAMIQNL
jgi:hypothetical protein